MTWIDGLARWAAGPDETAAGDGAGTALLERRVSRRGALAVFGGTAAAVAAGTLGDPPAAEAIVRCCDPNNNGTWSCPDGHDCCCYLIPTGGGHNECCDPAKGQTCQNQPGSFDHGVQVVACCTTVCPNECCTEPGAVCDSSGYCHSCASTETVCGDYCCDTATEDCLQKGCLTKCEPDAVRCGADQGCCAPGERCVDNVCVGCASPKTPCGNTCCDAGSHCCDAARDLCCPDSQTCTAAYDSCICADGTCKCGEQCCTGNQACSTGECLDCPPDHFGCGPNCCPPGTSCVFPTGGGCSGYCRCDNGGLRCNDTCCAPDETCIGGTCHKCPSVATACVDHCCDPPFECSINTCECPDDRELCAGACCPSGDECVGGTCLPKCEAGEQRCGTTCCSGSDRCVDGTCRSCPSPTAICGDGCCGPPYTCFANRCVCPSGTKACASGCCSTSAEVRTPKTAELAHGATSLTVTCGGGCSGTLTLQAVVAHSSVLGALMARTRHVVLGKATFRVPAGRTSAKVKVHLSHAGLRYVNKHHGRLKVQAVVQTKGSKKRFLSRAFTLRSRNKGH
jgi:hypothetical protein